jgi:protein-tyrosine phosphatase
MKFKFLIFIILVSVITILVFKYYQKEENAMPVADLGEKLAPGQSLGIPSVVNLRDVGGYTTTSGKVVKRGLAYRSNELNPISSASMKQIDELGLKYDFDLRTNIEVEEVPDELPPGVKYEQLNILADAKSAAPAMLEKLMHDPVKANEALGGGKIDEMFIEGYKEFISLPSALSGYRQLFLALGNKEQLPSLFHCTTGKDRTGWATAALLTLLGVPQDVVMQDFLKSNDYILPLYQKDIDAFVAAGGEKEIPLAIFGVKPSYINASFDEMVDKYGTIENYFAEGLGIDKAGQEAIKKMYLEDK